MTAAEKKICVAVFRRLVLRRRNMDRVLGGADVDATHRPGYDRALQYFNEVAFALHDKATNASGTGFDVEKEMVLEDWTAAIEFDAIRIPPKTPVSVR